MSSGSLALSRLPFSRPRPDRWRSLATVTALLLGAIVIGGMAWTGGDETGPSLAVEDAYASQAISEGIAAMYFSVENDGAADRLVALSSDAGGTVTISKSDSPDGAMETMTELTELDLPPWETVDLEPGGTHLMVGPVSRDLAEGDEIELRLEFATAEPLTVRVPVLSYLSIADRIASRR